MQHIGSRQKLVQKRGGPILFSLPGTTWICRAQAALVLLPAACFSAPRWPDRGDDGRLHATALSLTSDDAGCISPSRTPYGERGGVPSAFFWRYTHERRDLCRSHPEGKRATRRGRLRARHSHRNAEAQRHQKRSRTACIGGHAWGGQRRTGQLQHTVHSQPGVQWCKAWVGGLHEWLHWYRATQATQALNWTSVSATLACIAGGGSARTRRWIAALRVGLTPRDPRMHGGMFGNLIGESGTRITPGLINPPYCFAPSVTFPVTKRPTASFCR
jgi:hypothetical protein